MRPVFAGDPVNPLNVSVDIPDRDALAAGRILYAAGSQSLSSGFQLNATLMRRVASVVVEQGITHAIAWLDGYYYVTGTRDHATVSALFTFLGGSR